MINPQIRNIFFLGAFVFLTACEHISTAPQYPAGTIPIGRTIAGNSTRYLTKEEAECGRKNYLIIYNDQNGVPAGNACAKFLTATQ